MRDNTNNWVNLDMKGFFKFIIILNYIFKIWSINTVVQTLCLAVLCVSPRTQILLAFQMKPHSLDQACDHCNGEGSGNTKSNEEVTHLQQFHSFLTATEPEIHVKISHNATGSPEYWR